MAPPAGLDLRRYRLINLGDGSVLLERWLRHEDAERYNRLWEAARVGTRWHQAESLVGAA